MFCPYLRYVILATPKIHPILLLFLLRITLTKTKDELLIYTGNFRKAVFEVNVESCFFKFASNYDKLDVFKNMTPDANDKSCK